MRKILLFFTFATILSACKQQEATSISTEESDEIAKTFKFASLKEQLSLKGAKTRVETGKNDFKKKRHYSRHYFHHMLLGWMGTYKS